MDAAAEHARSAYGFLGREKCTRELAIIAMCSRHNAECQQVSGEGIREGRWSYEAGNRHCLARSGQESQGRSEVPAHAEFKD
jgi:hypothetical protein